MRSAADADDAGDAVRPVGPGAHRPLRAARLVRPRDVPLRHRRLRLRRADADDALDTFHSFPGAPVPWRSVPYDGDGPGARVSHAMLMLEHYMYVLGGGGGNRSFNDLRRLDLYTMHWELLETNGEGPDEKPDALIGHSVSWVEPYVVVFGGGDGRKPSNDLHTLDLRTLLWRRVQTENAAGAACRTSSTQLGSEMWVFGRFSKGKYYDVHVLDVEQLEWRQVIVAGTPPRPRLHQRDAAGSDPHLRRLGGRPLLQ